MKRKAALNIFFQMPNMPRNPHLGTSLVLLSVIRTHDVCVYLFVSNFFYTDFLIYEQYCSLKKN